MKDLQVKCLQYPLHNPFSNIGASSPPSPPPRLVFLYLDNVLSPSFKLFNILRYLSYIYRIKAHIKPYISNHLNIIA